MHTLEDVRSAIEASWSAETAFPDGTWTSENPARAQCVVTSLVVQHYFGGDLEKLTGEYEGKPESHYRNVFPDARRVDLTISQYPAGMPLHVSAVNLHGFKDIREKMINEPDTKARYELLLARVETKVNQFV